MAVVGNKTDLIEQEEITIDEASQFATVKEVVYVM